MSLITCRSNKVRGVREVLKEPHLDPLYNYLGGSRGLWRVTEMTTLTGLPLKPVTHVDIARGPLERIGIGTSWILSGVVSHTRYVSREEDAQLLSRKPALDRGEATCAKLIPIKKSAAWWNLPQNQQHDLMEARSQHIATWMRYLPAIARRLIHGRDLGEQFDYVTWFEFSPQDSAVVEDLLYALRGTDEWKYVERETDIWLVRA